jgi:hypothetical protein
MRTALRTFNLLHEFHEKTDVIFSCAETLVDKNFSDLELLTLPEFMLTYTSMVRFSVPKY